MPLGHGNAIAIRVCVCLPEDRLTVPFCFCWLLIGLALWTCAGPGNCGDDAVLGSRSWRCGDVGGRDGTVGMGLNGVNGGVGEP